MKKRMVILGLVVLLGVSGIFGFISYNKHVEAEELKIVEQQKKAEAERIEKEKEQKEKIAKKKAEQERLAKEKAEQERIAAEKAKQEQIAKEKAEQERLAEEKRVAELKKETDQKVSEGKADYSHRVITPSPSPKKETVKQPAVKKPTPPASGSSGNKPAQNNESSKVSKGTSSGQKSSGNSSKENKPSADDNFGLKPGDKIEIELDQGGEIDRGGTWEGGWTN